MKLSDLAIMNTWCEKVANATRKTYITHPDSSIHPNRKWALFSTTPILQKITGQMDDAVIGQKTPGGSIAVHPEKTQFKP
jgi:hypothetical protein